VSELNPDVLSGGFFCLFCRARPSRTANSTPLIAIGRNFAPFEKLIRKVFTQMCQHLRERGLSINLAMNFLGTRIHGMRATWPTHRRSRRLFLFDCSYYQGARWQGKKGRPAGLRNLRGFNFAIAIKVCSCGSRWKFLLLVVLLLFDLTKRCVGD
jgi:hypothetical protein